MKLSQATKPSTGLILSPTSRIRTRYAALMMLGIGIMLFAVAGSMSKDQAAAVGGWGVGFLLLSVLLLGVIGIAAVWGNWSGWLLVMSKMSWRTKATRIPHTLPALPRLPIFPRLPTLPIRPMITN